MLEYESVLRQSPLFRDIEPAELKAMLSCLSATERAYKRGATIFRAGDKAQQIGLVLSGQVDILQPDFWGNQVILSRMEEGDIFAESFVLAQADALPVSAICAADSAILLLDYRRMLHTCTNACAFHDRLIANLLAIVARKNIALTQKIEQVTRRTTREKLLSFLSNQAQRAGSDAFTIPFDRQSLADYLAVDRSAMSTELGRMQREGLLEYRKNWFRLHATGKPLA